MFVPYNSMPQESRVWIYQSNRSLTENEITFIRKAAAEFLEAWSAHGEGLKSSVEIKHNRFLIILLDESHADASGCSIDSSVHFIQNLEGELDVNFLDRTQIPFMYNGSVETEHLTNIPTRVKEGQIKPETLTFDNLVRSKQQLEENWMVPAKSTWLEKYFR